MVPMVANWLKLLVWTLNWLMQMDIINQSKISLVYKNPWLTIVRLMCVNVCLLAFVCMFVSRKP